MRKKIDTSTLERIVAESNLKINNLVALGDTFNRA